MEQLAKIKIKAKAKVEKYAEGITQEQIDSGEATPFEVVETEEEEFEVTEEQAKELGLIK